MAQRKLQTPKKTDNAKLAKWQPPQPSRKKQGKALASLASSSEVTVYKRAVQELAPQLGEQIDKFISDTRKSTEDNCKVSYFSDEVMAQVRKMN